MKSMVEAVAAAIEKASNSPRAYGLYDFSNYPGDAPPHVVRYELAKRDEMTEIARFDDRATAKALYDKLSREYVAQQAIRAMTEWMAADVAHSWAQFNAVPFLKLS